MVLAIGIFGFAVLSIVGVMSAGLDSVTASNNSLAVANITRFLRANYQGMVYSAAGPAANAASASNPTYFTGAGYPTNPQNVNAPIFYTVTCAATATNAGVGSLVSSQNASVITVQISYPYPANAQASTFSLFLAQ